MNNNCVSQCNPCVLKWVSANEQSGRGSARVQECRGNKWPLLGGNCPVVMWVVVHPFSPNVHPKCLSIFSENFGFFAFLSFFSVSCWVWRNTWYCRGNSSDIFSWCNNWIGKSSFYPLLLKNHDVNPHCWCHMRTLGTKGVDIFRLWFIALSQHKAEVVFVIRWSNKLVSGGGKNEDFAARTRDLLSLTALSSCYYCQDLQAINIQHIFTEIQI